MDSIAEKINKIIDPLNQGGNERTAHEIQAELLSLLEAVAEEQVKHDEFKLDEASIDHKTSYPKANSASFKDGALWMLNYLKENSVTEQLKQQLS